MYENDRSQSPIDDMLNQEQQNRSSVSRSRSRSPMRRSRSRSRSRSSSHRDDRHRDRARRINLISKRIIISNIPYEMKWQDIKDIFRKEVGDVTYVELFENTQGKSKGQGVIEFKDKDTARKAIENMHRYKIKDRNIVVREERESDRNMIGRGVMGSGPSGGGMMGGGGGMMGNMGGGGGGGGGVSHQVLNQLGIEGPVTNQVFVSNLDYKVTWKKLKDVFRLAGNVTRAEVKEDKEGKSRGMGTVTFETQFEAVQAVSMFNGQSLFDRQMRVKMDAMGAADKSSSVSLPSGLKSIGAGLGPGGTPLSNMTGGMGYSGSGMGMGGGMGGNMGGSGMGGGMGMNMDSGMGMNNMGMSNMGNMGSSGNMGMGMNSMGNSGNYGSSGMGMSNMGSSGMGMGMSSGMSDNYNMGGSNYNSSGYSGNMSGGMGDSMGGMGSNMNSSSMSSSAYSTGISDMSGMMNRSSGYGGGSSRSGSNYGMSSGSYSSSSGRGGDRDRDSSSNRSTRPDNCTVVVKNLPWKVTWQDLKEKFRSVADVKFAEIKMENGKSQGWGLVRFGSADDAQSAISMMNRTRLDGREIDVKLYR